MFVQVYMLSRMVISKPLLWLNLWDSDDETLFIKIIDLKYFMLYECQYCMIMPFLPLLMHKGKYICIETFTNIYIYLQAKARHGSSSGGLVKTGKKIVGQSGVSGLYRGLDTKLIQSMTAAGFMFMSYENIYQYPKTVFNILINMN